MSKGKHAAKAARRSDRHHERLERRQLMAAHVAGSTVSYATIQAAVDAAPVNGTVTVDAGTYNETVTVSKTLTLRGAQAGVDARLARGAETHVFATQTVFDVRASDVVIDGFTIEGNRADIGAALGAGVLMRPGTHGTQVLNDVVQNNVTGIYLANDSNTDRAFIYHNLIQNNFEKNNDWATKGWNGSRGIYSDGEVSGGYLTNVTIDANTLFNSDANGGDEDQGMIALQALTAGKQFDITITNNKIGNESKAILVTNATRVTFMGNTCNPLWDGPSGPVRFEGNVNTANVQYNQISGNYGPGVAIDSSGVEGDSSGFVVNNNNIYNNGSANIGVIVSAADYNGPLIAVGNWWGAASGPSGLGSGTGASVWGDGRTGHGVTATGLRGGVPVTFSPWATKLIDITRIPAPVAGSGLSAVAASTASVQLSWTPAMSTATSQLLQRSTDGVNFTTVATLPPLLPSYTDAGLAAGTAYAYRVVAANAAGTSPATATAKATTLPAGGGGTVPISSLAWASATSGYATVQRNASVAAKPITVGGVTYATGLGTHAVSTITYNLAAAYGTFAATVGVDQEVDGKGTGSVDFKVVGDGVTLFDSGVMTNDQAKTLSVNVAGVKTLQLVATNGVAGSIDYDHADWANATLTTAGTTPTPTATVPAAPTNVTATALSANSVRVGWTAPAGTVTAYAIDRSTDQKTWTTVTTAAAGTGFTDPAVLSAGTTYAYRVRAVNATGSSPSSAVATVTTPAATAVPTYLSDLAWTSATSGWGTVHKDASVTGNTLTLAGVTYAKGLGTHAASTITYALNGAYKSFLATVGVDDEENGKGTGSVDFQVFGDGVLLFDSGVLTNNKATAVSVSLAGVKTLSLVASGGADGIDFDHADWAGARVLA